MYIFLLNIVSWLQAHELPCLIKKTFHIECPSCGIQRSFILLLKAEVEKSIELYPALIPLILFFCILFLNIKFRIIEMEKFLRFGISTIFTVIALSYISKISS